MQIQFDPNQEYQRDAVNAVLDLFEGQSKSEAHFSVVREFSLGTQLSGLVRTERALGNQLTLTEPKLRQNCHAVQERNDVDSANSGTPLEGWELPSLGTPGDVNFLPARPCLHFSVEMETGTGKTYVYLRTIYELAERYGWLKFIIVVPSVAIREGVKENLRITAEHFRSLYHQTARVQVYEGKRVQELKEFAQSNTLQVLVINIDAFNKNFGPDAERKNNVIFKEQEGFENSTPIETVQASQPIVILDEPQSIDNTERAQEAIKALRPLFTLRYSATHKNPYNVVYRLGPIEAFDQRLVKQIVVDSAEVEGAGTSAFIHVKSIDSKTGFKAKLQIHAQGKEGPKPKLITVKDRSNLFHESNERAAYKDGFVVREISVRPGEEFIEFVNGIRLGIGQQHGGVRDDVQGAQIRRTVKHHLEKELAVQNLGVKVLSLFFIDRVANYREYEADGPKPGRFAAVVEDALREFTKDSRYASLGWLKLPVDKLHDGYFAKDKKSGAIKDASGSTADDSTAYELIMQKKEELLSLATPLRFIFSHSALREGWDNPNVFQICTLNERQSTMTKRQEIGRGLRLPVNQQGIRVRDDSVNRLYVVANESYDEFARGLQANYAEDGVHFGRVSKRAFTRLMQGDGDEAKPMGMAGSQALWKTLQEQGILSEQGDVRPGVEIYDPKFQLNLPQEFAEISDAVIDLLRSHRIERHVQNDKDIKRNPRRQEQIESPEFKELWSRISARTRYRVEFETDELIRKAVDAVKRLPEIRPVEVRFTTAVTTLQKAGVAATPESQSHQELRYKGPLPDLLAYLQAQTDLTRSTLQRVLKTSGRLEEFLVNPQEFMDATVGALRTAMLELLIDGIQYERIPDTEADAFWEQERIFEALTNVDVLAAVKVKNSIYEWVPVDSKVEQSFAQGLDQRHLTFKLFVKLPRSFTVRTPVGEYQPDWAIVKQDDDMIYLIRETKGNRNYQKMRSSEAYKARCGHKHFAALGVSFDVVEKVEQV
jgi:type III restriction enzyme